MCSSERRDILRVLEAEGIPIPKGGTSNWDNCDMRKYLRRMVKEKKKEGEKEKGDDVTKGFPEEKEEKEQTSGVNTKLQFRRKCDVRIHQLSVTFILKQLRLNFLTCKAVFSCLCRKLRRIGRWRSGGRRVAKKIS